MSRYATTCFCWQKSINIGNRAVEYIQNDEVGKRVSRSNVDDKVLQGACCLIFNPRDSTVIAIPSSQFPVVGTVRLHIGHQLDSHGHVSSPFALDPLDDNRSRKGSCSTTLESDEKSALHISIPSSSKLTERSAPWDKHYD